MNRFLPRAVGAATAALALQLALPWGAAFAADDASIDHSEHSNGVLRMLVSVPGTDPINLDSVGVTLDGVPAKATAEAADTTNAVQRTAILAIDTSRSMSGKRIAEAKAAAVTYLDSVPGNVKIGIVTFDNSVELRQQPSLDRAASKVVIGALTLKLQTNLYAGVQTAVKTLAPIAGQRQVLVLSDGRDTTKTDLAPVLDAIKTSGVKVDVVSLEQGTSAPPPLQQMAAAGKGVVIPANTRSLTAAFTSEADVLARQVLVSVTVPENQKNTDASVALTLEAGGTTHTTSAFLAVRAKSDPVAPTTPDVVSSDTTALSIPKPLMYGGVGAIGVGLIVLLGALLSGAGREPKVKLAEQLQIYGATAASSQLARDQARARQGESSGIAVQARQAAETVLATNSGFEAKIAGRLEGAGMALKASEWLLMHIGIAFSAGLVGLLLTGGNLIGLVLFLLVGAIGPWLYLALKRSRRLKAFDAGLADTLQLMAGSLSAGLSLAQSMDTIVREGAEPITSEFKRAIAEARLGVQLEDALEGIAVRMLSEDFKWVVMAIRIQREVGGNLAELLTNVANTLREREYIRRHVRALSAEGRLSCWILGGLPPAFLAYLSLSKPTYVKPMFTTPIGFVLCGLMAVLLSVGIFWMSKVAKVEV